jgi:hypothetical protein
VVYVVKEEQSADTLPVRHQGSGVEKSSGADSNELYSWSLWIASTASINCGTRDGACPTTPRLRRIKSRGFLETSCKRHSVSDDYIIRRI